MGLVWRFEFNGKGMMEYIARFDMSSLLGVLGLAEIFGLIERRE